MAKVPSRAAYARAFRATWCTLLLLLPLALLGAGTVVAVYLANRFAAAIANDTADGSAVWLLEAIVWVVGATVAMVALLWCTGTVCHGCLVRARAAYQCCFCCFGSRDKVVTSISDLQHWLREKRQRADEEAGALQPRYATPVGHGWSFFLNKTVASAPRLFMHELTGRVDARERPKQGRHWYYAGTTIGELLDDLKREPGLEAGLTLASTPSHDTITLGGWVAACAHGTGGTLWTPTIESGVIVDQATGEQQVWSHGDLARHFGRNPTAFDPAQIVLVAVCVRPIANDWVRLDVSKWVGDADNVHPWWGRSKQSQWWLTTDSKLRCIFVGRRGSLMMIWKPSQYDDETRKHIDPHFCSRECRYFQADLLSVVQGARDQGRKWFSWPFVEAATKWDGLTRLSNANKFSPLISALGMAVATLYHNVEFFLKVNDMTARKLDRLQEQLIAFHKKHGGRTEIRFGVKDDNSTDWKQRGKVFLDLSLPNLNDALTAACEAIKNVFQTRTNPRPTVALHPGKTVLCGEAERARAEKHVVLVYNNDL